MTCSELDFRLIEDLPHRNKDVTVQGLSFPLETQSLEVEGRGFCSEKSYTKG